MATNLFGILAILYGICMAVFAYASRISLFQFTHSDSTGMVCLIGALFFLFPFLDTYEGFGLNYVDKDIDPFSPSGDNHRRLMQKCRVYHACWYLPVGFMFGTFIAWLIFPDYIQPQYSILSAFAALSGLWFIFVYPQANKLFN
ncbi:hypothetical protein [Gimesia sp.]|uniref:hypothetical protein n=1 Tax=Gimesia sp. TaxID=2024833 RepID=UPI0032EDE6AA